jgi:VIT1/CCC1 family predicted Fe2+/Mn2+ transporter
MFLYAAHDALIVSIVVTIIALFVFGYVQGHYTGAGRWKSAMQTTIVGGLAAAAAFLIAKAIT